MPLFNNHKDQQVIDPVMGTTQTHPHGTHGPASTGVDHSLNGTTGHTTTTGAALDPTDHRTGINSGTYGHNTTTGAALDPTDHRTGVNGGTHGHNTTTGAALDPTDHRAGVNSHHTPTGPQYIGGAHGPASTGAYNTTGTATHGHSTGTGAALDPTDHRTGVNSHDHHATTGTGAAPSSTLHNSTSTTHPAKQSTGGKELIGKIEVTAGKVLHNAKLVEKGELKLEQAHQIKVQGAELTEAERLEHEAKLRRERAVDHGADPSHAHRDLAPGTGVHGAGVGSGLGGAGPGTGVGGMGPGNAGMY